DGVGAPPELLWRKNLALLVSLARPRKRARTREHLLGLLWAEKLEKDARHSLNEAVRILRRYLGDGGLTSDTNQVRLGAGAVELDIDRLEALVAGRDYAAAAALVSGEFLEGFSVPGASGLDDWVAAERTFWRSRSVDALLHRVDELLRAGSVTAAQAVAQRAAALERRSDAAARAGMCRLAVPGARAGARTAAVRAVEADMHDPWSGVHGIARGGLLEAPGVAGAAPPSLTALRAMGAAAEPVGRALSEVLRAISDEQPVLVLVDDAQWVDRESLLALGAVARDLTAAPLFLLFTITAQPPRAELDALRE